jgi:hypothetical protein
MGAGLGPSLLSRNALSAAVRALFKSTSFTRLTTASPTRTAATIRPSPTGADMAT